MCGIGGIVFKSSLELKKINFNKILRIQNHRGPEESNFIISKNQNVVFFHNRLKIIDLSNNASQPVSFNDNLMTFNGEIYNYKELSYKYFKKDDALSDTKLLSELLNFFELSKFKNDLRGMYAFSYYSNKKNTISLHRDPFGIKPIYYSLNKDFFVFGSEIKFIKYFLSQSAYSNNLDNYFSYGYNIKNATIYKNIKSVPMGAIINFKLKDWSLVINKSNNLKTVANSHSLLSKDYEENVYLNFKQSIERNLVADKKITVLQSSGIDSNCIISEVKKHYDNLETYSVILKEADIDESKEIIEINKKNKIRNNLIMFSEKDFLDIFSNLNHYFDEPFYDPSIYPLIKLFNNIKRKYDVALSGDGADEIFLGYNRYYLDKILFLRKVLPLTMLTKKISIITIAKLLNYLNHKNIFYKSKKLINFLTFDNLFQSIYLLSGNNQTYVANRDLSLSVLLDFDFENYLPNNILLKSDLSSMISSVELRVPYLDVDLFKAVRLKDIYNYRTNYPRKKILRKILTKNSYYLPKVKKRGFDMPIKNWCKIILKNYTFNYSQIYSQNKSFNTDLFLNQLNLIDDEFKCDYSFLFNRLIFLKWNNILY